MKPFNLEQALAGAPVQTRDGRKVTQLVKFDLGRCEIVAGVLEGDVHRWKLGGTFNNYSTGSSSDLFMAPVKKTGWVARYKCLMNEKCHCPDWVFPTEEAAKAAHPVADGYHQIEWEE